MKIFSGTQNPKLADAIAHYLGTEVGAADIVSFPDGETFVKIKDVVRGEAQESDCIFVLRERIRSMADALGAIGGHACGEEGRGKDK